MVRLVVLSVADPRSATLERDSGGVRRRDGNAERPSAHECMTLRIRRRFSGVCLDAHQLIVFLDSLATARRARLEASGVERHGEIGDEGVHGLAASMRYRRTPVGVEGRPLLRTDGATLGESRDTLAQAAGCSSAEIS